MRQGLAASYIRRPITEVSNCHGRGRRFDRDQVQQFLPHDLAVLGMLGWECESAANRSSPRAHRTPSGLYIFHLSPSGLRRKLDGARAARTVRQWRACVVSG